jgi:diguanylate cyclase
MLNEIKDIQTLQNFVGVSEALEGIALWQFDLTSQSIFWSNLALKILGFDTKKRHPDFKLFKNLFVDSGDILQQHFDEISVDNPTFQYEAFIRLESGQLNKIRVSGALLPSDNNQQNKVLGLIIDITEQSNKLSQLVESQRLLEDTSAVANIGHWRLNLLDNSLFWSDEVYRIHGYKPGEIRPELEMAVEAYHPNDRKMVAEAVKQSQKTGKPYNFQARIIRPSGEVRYVIAKGQIRQQRGVDIALFGVFQDITEQINSQQQNQQWNYLVNETPEAVVITDSQGQTTWVNKALERLSGYRYEEFVGKSPGKILQGPDTDQESVKKISKAIKAKEPITLEILNYTKLGEAYWIMLSIFPRFDDEGNVAQFMAIEIDITDRVESENELAQKQNDLEKLNFKLARQKQAAEDLAQREADSRHQLEIEIEHSKRLQEELRILANTDVLTGIANRRYFMIRAESEFQRATRYHEDLHLVMFDIDHFKQINDRYGHQVGDVALQKITEIVKACLRDKIDMVGRLGGEEFGILLPHTSKDDAFAIAERIRLEISKENIADVVRATCSFGIARVNDFEDISLAFSKADEALYRVKNSGRNRVEYW